MKKKVFVLSILAVTVLAFVLCGCKGKVENNAEESKVETSESSSQAASNAPAQTVVTEPSQTVASEAIPPTAAPQIAEQKVAVTSQTENRDKEIQRALKNAGFYAGTVDGKIGPKTKKAIEEFQKAKGLKVDGKVGPKTWSELEKYLTQ